MLPKTGKVLPKRDGRGTSKLGYAAAVATALRDELGESHRAIKIVMRWTGASERTAKYWFAGTRGPTGEHLLALVRHSDAVFTIFLHLTGREISALAVKLVDARTKLGEMLECIDELLNDEPARHSDRDKRDRHHF